jgi:ParB-like chromosome segregation protein Spo0J
VATGKEVQLNVGDLLSHPLNTKLYGEREADKSLQASIEKLGVLEPITVLTMPALDGKGGQRTYVLSGHRRVLAAKKAQLKKIPARYADIDPKDNLAVEEFIIEANRQRVKTEEQRGREIIELLRIEKIRARDRQLATLRKGSRRPVRANLPTRGGRAMDIAAESLGMARRSAEKLVKIIEAVDAGNEKARAALDAVNDRKRSIDKAFKAIKT